MYESDIAKFNDELVPLLDIGTMLFETSLNEFDWTEVTLVGNIHENLDLLTSFSNF